MSNRHQQQWPKRKQCSETKRQGSLGDDELEKLTHHTREDYKKWGKLGGRPRQRGKKPADSKQAAWAILSFGVSHLLEYDGRVCRTRALPTDQVIDDFGVVLRDDIKGSIGNLLDFPAHVPGGSLELKL